MFQVTQGKGRRLARLGVVVSLAGMAIFNMPAAAAQGSGQPQRRSGPARRPCAQAIHYYRLNPDSGETSDKLLKCFKTMDKPEEAAAIFHKTAEKPGGPLQAWKYAGDAYAAADRFPEAEAAYQNYLKRKPKDWGARLDLGRVYQSQKAYDKALEQIRMVLAARRDYPPALTAMARVYSWQGQREESLQLYDRVLRLRPKDAEAATGKAYVLLWMGRAEEAQALFSKLRQEHPKDSSIAKGLELAEAAVQSKAVALARQSGNTAPLEAVFRQRLAENPKDLDALKALAELTADPQRCADNIGYRRQALEISPQNPGLEMGLARALASCNLYEQAIASYRRVLEMQPDSESALVEMGHALRRTRQLPESIEAFRKALQVKPDSSEARLGLALSLSGAGNREEALLRFDEVLEASPDNYEALQGKGHILYWNRQFAQARAIFQALAARRPADRQNTETLEKIARAEEEAHWAALRPRPDAPPEDFLAYYQKRLAKYPNDRAAMKGLAYTQALMKNRAAAIQSYRQVLAVYPDDRSSKMDLARLLSWEGELDAAIALYREVLQGMPDDTDAMENLARVYIWGRRPQEALQVYQSLLAHSPANLNYQLEVARLQVRLKDSPAAREFLTAVLSADPKNRAAILLLAQLNMAQGQTEAAIQQFDQVLKQDPKDSDALFGKARALYYQGDHSRAYALASELVKEQPTNVDALFLLASLQRARHNRGAALALLDETLKISPSHSAALALRETIREAGVVTLRTSASYAREIGKRSRTEEEAKFSDQDLRMFSYGATLGFPLVPRTDSYLSLSYLPSNTPFGGLRGAVGPSQFLYRQTTRLTRRLNLRAGAGMVRFGPGELVNLPGQPERVPSAKSSPQALAGIDFSPNKRVTLDLAFHRSGITYTPTSVRFGVIENRLSAGASISFTPRTHLYLDYNYGRFSSREYDHISFLNKQRLVDRRADRDTAHSGTLFFNVNVVRSPRFAFDAGYQGEATGNPGRQVFLGFFNPSSSHHHLFESQVYAKLVGPLSVNLRSGFGTTQNEDEPYRLAVRLRPAFTIKLNSRVSMTFGYTFYNTSQALRTLSGNIVYFRSEWRF